MASPIDICNMALAHLGEIPNVSSIDPPEGSSHAEKCARFYPVARDVTLEMRNWPFALKRVRLAEVENDLPGPWHFKYQLPSDCLRAIAVLPEGAWDDETQCADFVTESGMLYTNAHRATLRYLHPVSDTTRFPPTFVAAVSWLLASYLAGAITRDTKVKQWCYEVFREELNISAQSAANASQTTQDHTPGWISKR